MLMKGDKPLTAWDTRPEEEESRRKPPLETPAPSLDTRDVSSGRGEGGRRGAGGEEGRRQQQQEMPRQEVVRVTAEAARAGVFSIKHVVLPLPGKV